MHNTIPETQPENNDERKTAQSKWVKIVDCMFYDETNTLSYDIRLPAFMNSFEFWCRDQLNKKGLLYSRTDDPSKAIARF